MSPAPEPVPPVRAAPAVRFRQLHAYLVTARVLFSYLALTAVGWLRGSRWHEAALARAHRRNAGRVLAAVLRLQGLFVKVGQLVSMLSTVLPAEFRSGLEALQDQVPARPWSEVAARLEAELGAPPDVLFTDFDRTAIASASLAQVHAARLADGRRVAVKVQHLGIEETARRDLRAMRRILVAVSLFVRVRGLRAVHAQVRAMIEEELDFAREATNLEAVARSFAGDPTVVFPAVVHDRSTRRVLTTTFVDGIKVSRRAALDASGLDPRAVAERLLDAYCKMIFEHGVYHADPHPGNLFVRPADGAVAFVDFGAVGRLSNEMREGIPEFLSGVLAHDTARLMSALRRMGFVARGGDEQTAERVVGYLHRRFLDQLAVDSWNLEQLEVSARVKLETLADLRRLDVSLRDLMELFEVPRDWVLLERTLLLLVGLCADLGPALNPMATLRPHLERLALGRDRNWQTVVGGALRDLAVAAVAVPGDLRRLVARIERGELEMRVGGVREGFELLYAAAHQLLLALIAASSGLVAYLAHARDETDVAGAATAVAALAALLLLGSLARTRSRRRRARWR